MGRRGILGGSFVVETSKQDFYFFFFTETLIEMTVPMWFELIEKVDDSCRISVC